MRNRNLLKTPVSEICVKRIPVNQGVGVLNLKMWEKFELNLPVCFIIAQELDEPTTPPLKTLMLSMTFSTPKMI